MQRKNNISSENAIKFINSLNSKFNQIQIHRNKKFYFHIPKNELQHPYAYLYHNKIEGVTKIIEWLNANGIDAIAKYIEDHSHYLIKIPHVNLFPHDFFDAFKLNEQQLKLVRQIKTENDNLKLFNDSHIKKLIGLVVLSFSTINKALEITYRDTNEECLRNRDKCIKMGIPDYLITHSNILKHYNQLLAEYYQNISFNLVILEDSLLTTQESDLACILLNSEISVSALEAVFEKMISYGVYVIQHVNAINRNNEIASFVSGHHLNNHEDKLETVLIKFKQINEVCDIINEHLSFFGKEHRKTKMFFVYKLNLLEMILKKEIVEEEEILFNNNKVECEHQLNKMNLLIDELQAEVNKLLNINEEKNCSAEIMQPKLATNPNFFAIQHDMLLRQIAKIIPLKERQKYHLFNDAIDQKEYSKALRTACTSDSAVAFKLIKLLMLYKGILKVDVNEQAGTNKNSALHYAALKDNKEVYDYLISQGAVQLQDADGKTPDEIFSVKSKRLMV